MDEELIKKMISERFETEVSESDFLSDFAEDSFAKVEMLFDIEQALGVNIPDQDIMDLETVGDLISAAKNAGNK
jgi:acyl carrier protein